MGGGAFRYFCVRLVQGRFDRLMLTPHPYLSPKGVLGVALSSVGRGDSLWVRAWYEDVGLRIMTKGLVHVDEFVQEEERVAELALGEGGGIGFAAEELCLLIDEGLHALGLVGLWEAAEGELVGFADDG